MGNPYAPPDPDRPPEQHAPRSQAAGPLAPNSTAPGTERQPDPGEQERARQLTRTSMLLVTAAMLVLTFPAPWGAASLLFTATALVVALRGAIAGVRSRSGGRLVAPGLIIMLLSSGGLLFGAGYVATIPTQITYQQCLGSALTISAEQACTVANRADLEDLTERLTGIVPAPVTSGSHP